MGLTIQYLSITDLQEKDILEFTCNVRDLSHTGKSSIVATSLVSQLTLTQSLKRSVECCCVKLLGTNTVSNLVNIE